MKPYKSSFLLFLIGSLLCSLSIILINFEKEKISFLKTQKQDMLNRILFYRNFKLEQNKFIQQDFRLYKNLLNRNILTLQSHPPFETEIQKIAKHNGLQIIAFAKEEKAEESTQSYTLSTLTFVIKVNCKSSKNIISFIEEFLIKGPIQTQEFKFYTCPTIKNGPYIMVLRGHLYRLNKKALPQKTSGKDF